MIYKNVLKGTRWLLLKNPENLMKGDLRQFWEQPGKRFATAFLNDWIRRAVSSGIKMRLQRAKTLAAHRGGLLAYYDARITSGPWRGRTARSRR